MNIISAYQKEELMQIFSKNIFMNLPFDNQKEEIS